jgi:uncharacterized protein YqeY
MLRDDINNAVKDAMKAKEERKLSTLRMVNSTIKNADIAARGEGKPPLSDADLLGVFQKMIKQRQESVELYDKGGRAELAAQEREEIAIISAYLPKQMSEDEIKAAISAAVAETGAAGMKDMGKVIGVLRAKFAGQMDFGKASGMVKAADVVSFGPRPLSRRDSEPGSYPRRIPGACAASGLRQALGYGPVSQERR